VIVSLVEKKSHISWLSQDNKNQRRIIMDKESIERATVLANEVLLDQMKRNGHQVYEGSGGGQIFIIAVATLAAGILAAEAKKVE
jgi:hypothetical protein